MVGTNLRFTANRRQREWACYKSRYPFQNSPWQQLSGGNGQRNGDWSHCEACCCWRLRKIWSTPAKSSKTCAVDRCSRFVLSVKKTDEAPPSNILGSLIFRSHLRWKTSIRMRWLCHYTSKMITWFLTPNFWGFLLQLRRKWRGIMQIALSSWTVCTSFHIMIFLNDVFSVLPWRFGVQSLPSICGRMILLPAFFHHLFELVIMEWNSSWHFYRVVFEMWHSELSLCLQLTNCFMGIT